MTIRDLLIGDTKKIIRLNPTIRVALALLQVALTKEDYMDYFNRLSLEDHKTLKDEIAKAAQEATNGRK